MALSVSGFPESSQLFSAADSDHINSNNKTGNTPRLRALFSSNGGLNKPSIHSKPTSRLDSDSSLSPPATPRTFFSAPAFEPLSQQEYEKKLDLEVYQPRSQHATRAHLPPLPRQTSPSPVRLGSGVTRLEIGAATRSAPPLHAHSKSNPPPTVVVQDCGPSSSKEAAVHVHQPRPLPFLPSTLPELLNKPGSGTSSSCPTPFSSPGLGSSKPSSSRHVNAISSHSKYPNALPLSSSPSPPPSKVLLTQPPLRTHRQKSPSFSMRYQPLVVDFDSAPSPSPSFEPSTTTTTSNITATTTNTKTVAANSIRPLPRTPSSPSTISPSSGSGSSTRFSPPTTTTTSSSSSSSRIRRTRTSSSGYNSAPASTSYTSSSAVSSPNPHSNQHNHGQNHTRSALENIPSSWASRPVDLNSSRPNSTPVSGGGASSSSFSSTMAIHHPHIYALNQVHRRPVPMPPHFNMHAHTQPRARSHSRTRRERSLDSPSKILTSSQPVVPGTSKTSPTLRFLTSSNRGLNMGGTKASSNTTILTSTAGAGAVATRMTGARPLAKKPVAVVQGQGKSLLSKEGMNTTPLKIRTSGLPSAASSSSSTKATVIPELGGGTTHFRTISTVMGTGINVETKNEKLSTMNGNPEHATTPYTDPPNLDSPLEFFVDGPETEISILSRSPSPIRYARPSRAEDEYDLDDEDGEGGEDWECEEDLNVFFGDGEMSEDDIILMGGKIGSRAGGGAMRLKADAHAHAGRKRRRRTQLRAYRMSYRPRERQGVGEEQEEVDGMGGKSPVFGVEFGTWGDASTMVTPTAVSPIPVTPSVVLALPSKKSKERTKEKEKEKKKEKWSFGDFTSMVGSVSAPGTRASSPERKRMSRQPRMLAEVVSMALGGGGGSISSGATASPSAAPQIRRHELPTGLSPLPPPIVLSATSSYESDVSSGPMSHAGGGRMYDFEGDVLDIRMPLSTGRDGENDEYEGVDGRPFVGSDSGICASSSMLPMWITSTRTRTGVGVGNMRRGRGDREQTEGTEYCTSASESGDGSVVGNKGRRESVNSPIVFSPIGGRHDPPDRERMDEDGYEDELNGEEDGEMEEIPFMWLSKQKPPSKPMPLIPPPPPFVYRGRAAYRHQRHYMHVGSLVSDLKDAEELLPLSLTSSPPLPSPTTASGQTLTPFMSNKKNREETSAFVYSKDVRSRDVDGSEGGDDSKVV